MYYEEDGPLTSEELNGKTIKDVWEIANFNEEILKDVLDEGALYSFNVARNRVTEFSDMFAYLLFDHIYDLWPAYYYRNQQLWVDTKLAMENATVSPIIRTMEANLRMTFPKGGLIDKDYTIKQWPQLGPKTVTAAFAIPAIVTDPFVMPAVNYVKHQVGQFGLSALDGLPDHFNNLAQQGKVSKDNLGAVLNLLDFKAELTRQLYMNDSN